MLYLTSRMCSLLFVIACSLAAVLAYPNGAGHDACVNFMLPRHLDKHFNQTAPQDRETAPFAVTVDAAKNYDLIEPGQEVTLTLHGPFHFQGFVIAAVGLDNNGDEIFVGHFTTEAKDAGSVHFMCGGTAATHTLAWRNSEENSLKLKWKAPEDVFSGAITFHATFVLDYSTFWLNIIGDKGVYVAHSMAGSFIPPQEGQGPTTNFPELTESSSSFASTEATTERQADLPGSNTPVNEEEISPSTASTPGTQDVHNLRQESVTTPGEGETVSQVVEDASTTTEPAANSEKTTSKPIPRGESKCLPGDMQCMKRKVVSGIHSLIFSLEQMQKYIDPSTVGSTSSRR